MSKTVNHISLLTDGIYPFVMGGMQKHSYYLAKYFAKRKVKVDLYHFIPDERKSLELEFTETELEYIDLIEVPMPSADKLPGHYLRQQKKYSQALLERFRTQEKSQFIYAQGFTAWAFLENKKEINVPLGVNFHGIEPFQKAADLKSELQKQLLKPFMLQQLKKADYVFSLGSNLSKLLVRNGINQKQIIQIQIGIEDNWIAASIKPSTKPIQFVFIGRNERRKAVKEISIAIKSLRTELAQFHFIGPITALDLGLTESELCEYSNIHLHGSISSQEKIKSIVRSCDILICTSYSEGMPTVILEAMSSGLTALATDVGAVSELVQNNTGWLIESPKPHLIKNTILKILDTALQDIDEKKSNAQKLIQANFLWDSVIDKTLSEIEKTI
jgi:glycosyltransferase involved in cell wall biosynthesis